MLVFGMTPYQMAWYFLIYSFIGWVVEVIFHAVTLGKVINRGFLNGPVCPVYGFGVLSVFAMVACLGGAEGAMVESVPLWQLFLGGVLLATAVELLAGWALDKLFHARWWDYTDRPFNFHGYICLEFSLIWGLAIAFVVREVQPYIRRFSGTAIPERVGWPLLLIMYLAFAADVVVTVLTVLRLNRQLEELDRLRTSMRTVSDGMSRVIGGGTVRTVQEIEHGREKMKQAGTELRTAVAQAEDSLRQNVSGARESLEERRQNLNESVAGARQALQDGLAARREQAARRQEELYHALKRERVFGTGRLLRAFPEMRHTRFGDTVRWIQEKLNEEEHRIQ